MTITNALTSLFVSLAFAAAAQAAEAPSCGDLPCRTDGLAYVSEAGGIVIMPGEAFLVELKIEEGRITAATPRAANANVANAIELKFHADNGMMLQLTSRVDHTIKVDMFMKLPDGRLVPTSSCPIMHRMGGFETWQDRIVFLELRNFRILNDGNVMSCS